MSQRPPSSEGQAYKPFAPLPRPRSTPPPPPPPPGMRRPRRRRSALLLPLVLLLLLCAMGLGGLWAYQFYLGERIVPGVRVLGEEVGGMTRAEAEARLNERLGDPNVLLARFGGGQIILRDGSRVFRAWPWELGFRSDFKPALDAAFAIGHRLNLVQAATEQAQALLFGAEISTGSAFDEATAREYLSLIAPEIDRPARDAGLRLEGLTAVETPAQKGRYLDAEETLKRIRARLADPNGGEVELVVKELDPQPVDTETARAQIESFLSAPLLLTFGDRQWAIDQATLASLISVRPVANPDGSIQVHATLSRDALVAKVQALAREIDQAPRDARLHFSNGVVTVAKPSQEGRTLDVDATVRQIESRFASAKTQTRAPGNASPAGRTPPEALRENAIPLSVVIQKPAVDMRDLPKMGIKELVAQGVSNYQHSIPGRIQNIKTATSSFDGVVIPPGGIFSFNQYLIDVVEANGYEDAYVIFGNRTVLGPGGGVCQVSSTIFRAAFFGGFPILERWAHAYRVSYYEPPVGLDATVFAPDVDLKFKNDTEAYLLIEPQIDEKNTTLTFNFYGTKPNREVKLIGPQISNIKPHGPAIYNEDPSLPKGVTKQVDFAVDGEDVTIFREIYVNGQMVKRDRFFSRYAPWQAVYQVGTRE